MTEVTIGQFRRVVESSGYRTEAERDHLLALQRSTNVVMLRKARAAVLLRFRGRHIPAEAELVDPRAPG